MISPTASNPLLYYEVPKERKKTLHHSNTYKSFQFGDDKQGNEEPFVRHNKKSKYAEYNYSTQIYALPGGVKREYVEKSKMNKINEQSIKMKMNSDFSSKISCLPGTMTKEVEDENKKRHKKSSGVQKYNAETKEERNIFRKGKKTPLIGGNNKETIDNDNTVREGKRKLPPGIRDQFKSQFSFC